jgi:tripartite-type tricarboxylate transporter receptor subunit TctC
MINKFQKCRFYSLLNTIFFLILIGLFWQPNWSAAADGCIALRDRNIRWVVPASAGGGYDTYSRLIAPYYGARLGGKILVENFPGGGGIVAGNRIAKAKPDGTTIGIINTPGLLTAAITGITRAPNPAKDFTILGRVAHSTHVLVTGHNSGLQSMADVFTRSKSGKPIIIGVTDVGGSQFTTISVVSHILGINAQLVPGYPGTRQTTMAAIRDEVDLVSSSFSSVRDRLKNGELRALMQVAKQPIAQGPLLKGVPLLGGSIGLAAKRAKQLGNSVADAIADADGIIGLNQVGRLVVAPAGISAELTHCLRTQLMDALSDPAFLKAAQKAKRPIDPADSSESLEGANAAMAKAAKFAPIVKAAIEQVRK